MQRLISRKLPLPPLKLLESNDEDPENFWPIVPVIARFVAPIVVKQAASLAAECITRDHVIRLNRIYSQTFMLFGAILKWKPNMRRCVPIRKKAIKGRKLW